MFKWYEKAGVCYAFLSDLPPRSLGSLGSCRWFTRGWTLQELLAPRRLEFYDEAWSYVGAKRDLADVIIDSDQDQPTRYFWNASAL